MLRAKSAAIAALAILGLSLAACGGSHNDSGHSAAAPASKPASMTPAGGDAGSMAPPTGAGAAEAGMSEFGEACSAVPSDPANPGSFAAMATVPVATAASANPVLSTLVGAVKRADLVDSLNSAKAITVFAPANSAFAKVGKATMSKVLNDRKTLTSILTYHVVPGRLSPARLAGTHRTLQGGTVTIAGSGTHFTVNGTSTVVCGNVQTSNATVYIVDTVLMPRS